MHEAFWLERWEQNLIGFHQEAINSHLQLFWPRLGVATDAAVFVPLCGKSRDMLWLRSQGHPVLGIEISEKAVTDFFSENELEPEVNRGDRFDCWQADGLTVLCGDLFDLAPEDLAGCRGVYDRASLIALPTDMRRRYAEHLKRVLPLDSPVLLVTLEYPQEQMPGPPFSVDAGEIETLFEERYGIDEFFALDILSENPRFEKRGLSRLEERVFRLRAKS